MSDDDYRPHLTVVPPATLLPDDGPAVAGLEPATPEPALLAIPDDSAHQGGWVPVDWPSNDAPDDAGRTPPITVQPVPLIGAIPFGGRILQVGQEVLAVGASLTIGTKGSPTPDVTVIRVMPLVESVDVVSSPDQLSRGFNIWGVASGVPYDFPLRQLVLRNNGGLPATVQYIVMGYDVPKP